MNEISQRYPKTINCQGESIDLDLLKTLDSDDTKIFTDKLTDHDLLSVSRDLKEPKVIEAWNESLKNGQITGVVARRQSDDDTLGEIVGTTAVIVEKYSWSAHVGELRILVSNDARNIGLGRELIQESFLMGLDLGLEKLTVRMTLDQEAAITVLEEMGFKTEALLKDHVKDRSGRKHDLILMSHDVESMASRLEVYGLDQV